MGSHLPVPSAGQVLLPSFPGLRSAALLPHMLGHPLMHHTTTAHYYNQGGIALHIPEHLVLFVESQVQMSIRVGGLFGLGNSPTSPWLPGILAYLCSDHQGDGFPQKSQAL